jgi:hypothetical protein
LFSLFLWGFHLERWCCFLTTCCGGGNLIASGDGPHLLVQRQVLFFDMTHHDIDGHAAHNFINMFEQGQRVLFE